MRWVRETIDDGGLALRLIRRHFLFSATVVATLSLGIGASTAMFSAVYGVLLRPLPYADPNRLVVVWSAAAGDRTGKLTVPFGDFERWRRDARSFTSLAAASWFGGDSVLTGRGAPRALLDVRVSDNIFQVLGVSASIGRTFDGRDHPAGCVAVLSDRFWQSLGADDRVGGDALRLSGRSCTVVGVMPASFTFFPEPTDLWTVIPSATGDPANGPPAGVAVFGRLAPDATIATATSELQALADAGAGERAPHAPRLVPVVNPLHEEFTWLAGRNLRVTLVLLFGAVSCLLAIACLNVANLMLGRSIVRRREIAIRSALGSSWVRVLRQLTIETLLLTSCGALCGVGLAAAGLRYLRVVNPIQLPPGADITISAPVIAFTAALAIVVGLIVGLAPMWRASGAHLGAALSSGGRAGVAPSAQRFGRLLVVVQAALSVVLLVGAALLIQSESRFAAVPLGFDPDSIFSYGLVPPAGKYSQPENRARLYRRLLDRFAAEPAVGEVALSTSLPPRGDGAVGVLEREGVPPPDPQHAIFNIAQQSISDRYFEVMRVHLDRGRPFGPPDTPEALAVCIVNAALVRNYFGRSDPIGRRIRFAGAAGPNPWLTIVGVAADEKRTDVRLELGWVTRPIVYRPITQRAAPAAELLVRPRGDLATAAIQRLALETDDEILLGSAQPLSHVIEEYFRYPQFRARLLFFFAGIALFLATVGLYGVLAQAVAQRTRDIGVRMALGASRMSILGDVIKEGTSLVGIGVTVGLLALLPIRGLLSGLLYGVAPLDPATLLGVAAALLLAGFSASYLPARRASSVDPIEALRSE